MSRSTTPYSLPRDSNRIPAAGAVLLSDGISVRPLNLDSSGNLLVNVAVGGGGGSGGTQYAELATTSPATGTLALGRYQTALPTLTNGQMNEPMLDSSSRLLINVAAGTVTANVGTTNGLALDATLTGGSQQVQGNIASSGTDSGNPLKVGGVQRTAQPTLTDGQRGDMQLDTRANLKVTLVGNGTSTAVTLAPTNADGVATSATGSRFEVVSRNSVYNGTTYDRMYGANAVSNTTGTGLAGAGQMVWDGTNWQKQKADTTGVPTVNTQLYPNSTALNTYSNHITTNTTTTPTAATAYISTITISSEVAGTTSTVTIQDKQGTPLKLVNGFSTTTLTTTPTVVNFQTPVKMVSGIDVITAGAGAATVDVWINYYQ